MHNKTYNKRRKTPFKELFLLFVASNYSLNILLGCSRDGSWYRAVSAFFLFAFFLSILLLTLFKITFTAVPEFVMIMFLFAVLMLIRTLWFSFDDKYKSLANDKHPVSVHRMGISITIELATIVLALYMLTYIGNHKKANLSTRPNQSINNACFAGSDPAACGCRSGYVGR